MIESTRHAVKDWTVGIGNMFQSILAEIGGTMQWCLILAIILVLLYINRSLLLKRFRGKPSGLLNAPTAPLSTPPTDSGPIPNKLVNPTFTGEQPTTLPLVLASFTLHDASASQGKSGVTVPITISYQQDHTSCPDLVDTGFPVTLLSEKIQCQLNLWATPLDSHYNLLRATGDTLTKLRAVQVDILLGRKLWPTPATAVSSLAQLLILGLNLLKLNKSKIDFETNTVKTESKIYPADTHCIKSYTSTIIIPASDVYRPFQLLLNKKSFWMVTFILITVIILTAVASHTHCHFKPPFGKQDLSFVSPERNLTLKELLTYGTSIRFTVRSLLVESKKNSRLYLLDWALPPVLAENLHFTNHLALGVYLSFLNQPNHGQIWSSI